MDVSEGEGRIKIFALANARGAAVRVTNYGAIVLSVRVPDRSGQTANVVLGYETVEEYARDTRYTGAVVGRCANRIANARFAVEGVTYRVTANAGSHHLHGGRKGFDKMEWSPRESRDGASLVLTYTSPDGEEGYPGTLRTLVTYTLTDQSELIVDYRATTDRPTHVNLTQHSYFNLAGSAGGDVLGHLLQIHADAVTPVDDTLIPTGAIAPVAGTDFDFRALTAIGARRGGRYDVNFVLNRSAPEPVHAARLVDSGSGRTLDVHTTEPGLQLYTGYPRGVCLETQHYPNSPNQGNFPSTLLRPESQYRSRTIFTFGVER